MAHARAARLGFSGCEPVGFSCHRHLPSYDRLQGTQMAGVVVVVVVVKEDEEGGIFGCARKNGSTQTTQGRQREAEITLSCRSSQSYCSVEIINVSLCSMYKGPETMVRWLIREIAMCSEILYEN